MGRYIDWGDVTARYPSAAKEKSSELGAAYIADAEGEVDARLAPKYAVPFVPGSSSAPQIVRTLSVDIAYYRCIWQTKDAKALREYIDARFEALIAGDMALVSSSGIVDPVNASVAWTSKPYRSAFGPDAYENFSPSASESEAAENERTYD